MRYVLYCPAARVSKREKAVTIYDVAQLAGVSASTVSRVVNGKKVDPLMTERVRQAITTTGFQPNQLARGLYFQQSRMLGCILPDISNPFYATLFMAVERRALADGYTLLLGNTLDELKLEARNLRIMSERQVDAIILTGGRINEIRPTAELLADTRRIQRRTPLVLVNGHLDGLELSTVQVDEVEGVRASVRHLLALGHRRIAFLGGLPHVRATIQKREAFAQELANAHAPPGLTLDGVYTLQAGAEAMRAVLSLPKRDWPSAIIGINDPVAVGAAHVAVGAGLSIPRDLSVVGFDDTPLASTFYPALTTVSHRYEALANLIVDAAIRSIEGEQVQQVLDPTLVVRASSGEAACS